MNVTNKVSNIQQYLAELGITEATLSEEEKWQLDKQGYVVFEQLLNAEQIARLQDKYEQLMEQEGQTAGMEVHQEEGTRRISDLVNKGTEFTVMYTHPKVLAAISYIIGRDFKLSSLNGRDAIPGSGDQPLHADWGAPRVDCEQFHVVNSIWMLDDFTVENGATRIVPGTHRLSNPHDYMPNPADAHPDEIVLTLPAGSVVVFNSHLLHGGTLNRSSRTRRGIFAYYTAREFPQQLNQREYIRVATYERLSDAAKYVLDVQPQA